MSTPKLSPTALALLHRIYDGCFYPAHKPARPAMQELIDAGLVRAGARVVTIASFYVPAKGFKTFTLDKLPDKPKWMTGGQDGKSANGRTLERRK